MTETEFFELVKALSREGIEVHEQVTMYNNDEPILDADGEQVVNDVVKVGDGRLYIERDGNEPESEQVLISFLSALNDFLPDIWDGLALQWRGKV
jgi:hypothetical protein